MPRYIDVYALKEALLNPVTNELSRITWGDIDNAPTVDAVKVVRCKDCIHLGQCATEIVMRRKVGSYVFFPMGSDGFCSWGVSKEDA